MRNHAFLKVALLGLLAFALMPGTAAAGQDLSEMLASSAAVHATAVSGPILQVAPLAHDYGVQDNGTNTQFNFTVSNIGDQPLHITSLSSSDPAFVAGLGSPIGPGASVLMAVSFFPNDGAFHSGNIMVGSDGGSVTVNVTGQG
ncbi:MAG TPA: hypothetical protein VHU20_00730, partial [Candidatus Eisenbacteria bacterium]|nr:hypothetical protein [Candidatus Eisenbacteria bacterium]